MEASKSFERITSGIKSFFEIIGELISKAASKIKNFFGSFSKNDSKGFQEAAEGVTSSIEPMEKVGDTFQKIGDKIKDVFAKIKETLSTAWNHIKEIGGKIKASLEYFFGELKFDNIIHVIQDLLKTQSLYGISKILNGIGDGAKNLGKSLENLSGFFENIKKAGNSFAGIFDDIRERIQAWKKDNSVDILKQVAVSLLLVAAALFVVSKVDAEKIGGSLGAITGLIVEVIGAMAIMNKLSQGNGFSGKSLNKLGLAMIEMSLSILIISSALKKIGDINPENLWTSVAVITALITEFTIATKFFSNEGSKQLAKGATGLISLALAINVLIGGVKKISDMDLPELAKGLGGVLALLISLAATTKYMQGIKFTNGLGILLLATSLIILEKVVEKFSKMEFTSMISGLFGVGIALAEIAVFLNFLPEKSITIGKAIAITILSASLLILAQAVENMSSINFVKMMDGLLGLGLALARFSCST